MARENRREIFYDTETELFSFVSLARALLQQKYAVKPLAFIHCYGCQQSVSDGERLRGILSDIGYGFTDSAKEADLVLFNTCAVRENAEQRVYGNIGALAHNKETKPDMLIAVTGCMTQQQSVADKLKRSFPYVDIVAGSNAAGELPRLLFERLSGGRRSFAEVGPEVRPEIYENAPVLREDKLRAYVPVMYGCDNFCSYCVVPYVRGRERSRSPQAVLDEIRALVESGCRDITLLGQNVNSYGKGLSETINFSGLLRRADAIEGDFRLRFMTSHPKDCTHELIDTIAGGRHICRQLHLPVQSGSDRILSEMNRRYTAEQYLALADYARSIMPDIALTSDIMIGFPNESREDFDATIALVKRARYAMLYTFIYSKRSGTAAAEMPDAVSNEEKSARFRELLAVQEGIGRGWLEGFVGRRERVLVEAPAKTAGHLSARTDGGAVVDICGGEELIGSFLEVNITAAHNTLLDGVII